MDATRVGAYVSMVCSLLAVFGCGMFLFAIPGRVRTVEMELANDDAEYKELAERAWDRIVDVRTRLNLPSEEAFVQIESVQQLLEDGLSHRVKRAHPHERDSRRFRTQFGGANAIERQRTTNRQHTAFLSRNGAFNRRNIGGGGADFLNGGGGECKCSQSTRCPPGAPGTPGDPGEPGVPGQPGMGGHEGYAGSLPPAPYSWDKSNVPCVVCPPGQPGAPGKEGVSGKQGQKGETGGDAERGGRGPKGRLGLPGPPGPAGETGNEGEVGRPGRPGTIGGKGTGGDPGTPGIQGPKGPPGRPGTDAADGQQGDRGANGQRGEPGRTGIAGVPGTGGPTGTAGIDGGYCELCNGKGTSANGIVDLSGQFGNGGPYRFTRQTRSGQWSWQADAPISNDNKGKPVLLLDKLAELNEQIEKGERSPAAPAPGPKQKQVQKDVDAENEAIRRRQRLEWAEREKAKRAMIARRKRIRLHQMRQAAARRRAAAQS